MNFPPVGQKIVGVDNIHLMRLQEIYCVGFASRVEYVDGRFENVLPESAKPNWLKVVHVIVLALFSIISLIGFIVMCVLRGEYKGRLENEAAVATEQDRTLRGGGNVIDDSTFEHKLGDSPLTSGSNPSSPNTLGVATTEEVDDEPVVEVSLEDQMFERLTLHPTITDHKRGELLIQLKALQQHLEEHKSLSEEVEGYDKIREEEWLQLVEKGILYNVTDHHFNVQDLVWGIIGSASKPFAREFCKEGVIKGECTSFGCRDFSKDFSIESQGHENSPVVVCNLAEYDEEPDLHIGWIKPYRQQTSWYRDAYNNRGNSSRYSRYAIGTEVFVSYYINETEMYKVVRADSLKYLSEEIREDLSTFQQERPEMQKFFQLLDMIEVRERLQASRPVEMSGVSSHEYKDDELRLIEKDMMAGFSRTYEYYFLYQIRHQREPRQLDFIKTPVPAGELEGLVLSSGDEIEVGKIYVKVDGPGTRRYVMVNDMGDSLFNIKCNLRDNSYSTQDAIDAIKVSVQDSTRSSEYIQASELFVPSDEELARLRDVQDSAYSRKVAALLDRVRTHLAQTSAEQ